jgi:hypothetical protein
MKRSSKAVKGIMVFALALAAVLSVAQTAYASGYGDPHNCEALAQGSNTGAPSYTPEPFDAAQIPGSPTFSFTNHNGASDSLVACQPHIPWQPNFNNANWDGYGNPFQCVELIDRYDHLRWGDNYTWGNAGTDWTSHPSHFAQEENGGTTAPVAGDILIWNNTTLGHIAVIMSVSFGGHYVDVLEQNFNYNGDYYTTHREISLNYGRYGTNYTHYVIGASYTAFTQSGGSFTGTDAASPVGWLH